MRVGNFESSQFEIKIKSEKNDKVKFYFISFLIKLLPVFDASNCLLQIMNCMLRV